jgi:hypothetical protein
MSIYTKQQVDELQAKAKVERERIISYECTEVISTVNQVIRNQILQGENPNRFKLVVHNVEAEACVKERMLRQGFKYIEREDGYDKFLQFERM